MKPTLRGAAKLVFGWDPEEKITSETAWLNGVRGLAAFLVLMAHYSMDYITFVAEAPFGSLMLVDSVMNGALPFRKGTRLWAPWRLPILHNFVSSAGGQVDLFFVISGFVLTWSFFGLAESENFSKLYTSLGSSVFRRWSRLFLPCIVVTYIYALQQDINDGRNVFWGFWTYLGEAASWINPFKPLSEKTMAPLQQHNAVVWTIPLEFSGSIYVFVSVLMLARLRFSRRFPIAVVLTFMAFWSVKSYLWLFSAGMCISDYARHGNLLKRDQPRRPGWQIVLWWVAFFLGWYLVGWPRPKRDIYTRPGFDWEEYIPLPPGWRESEGAEGFWWGCGAIIMIASACHLRLVRAFFETSLLQYLGKISFMLYLTHILLGGEVGRRIQRAAYAALCDYDGESIAGMQICSMNSFLHVIILVSAYGLTIPCVFVVASVLERIVDRPITKLGKIVDDLLLRKKSSKEDSASGAGSHPERRLENGEPASTMPEEERLLYSLSLDELDADELESKKLESDSSSSDAELPLHDRHDP